MGAPWEDYQNTSDNAAPWEDYAAKNVNTQQPIVSTQPQEESFWGDLKNAGSKFVEGISRPEPSAVRTFSPTIGAALNVAGHAGNLVTDVVGAGLRGAYRALPKTAQEGVSSVGKMIAGNPIVDLAKTAYGQIPEDVRNDLGNMAGVANIVPLAMGAKASTPIAKEAINIGQDVANLARWTNPASLDTQIGGIVEKNINKAIRPTVVGKRNATQIQNFYDNANTAVKSIVENKNNLNLSDVDDITHGVPKNLTQFSEAIDQTKKNVFRQYDDMKLAAGEAGAQVDLAPVVKELEGVIKNPVLNDLHPDIVNYAAQRMEALSARGTYTTSEAQDAITHLNKSLESFYKNPSYETANRAGVDAIIANNLRKAQDLVIENTAGEGYQGLKNTYGALKSIEKEVAQRAIVDARRNAKGLIDLTDIYTSGELVGGLLTMNPAMMTKGTIGLGIRKMHNVLNNPNRYVDKMFSGVDKLMEKEATPVVMKSKIGQKLQGVADRFKKDMPVDNAIDPFDF